MRWRPLAVAGALALVVSLGFAAPIAAQEDEGAITAQELVTMEVAEDLNLRDEPSAAGEVLTVMPAGSTVEVEAGAEPENEYLPVTFEDQEGWAFIAYLVDEGGDNIATVLEDLNLRDAPGLDGEVLAVMPAGAELRVFGSAEDDEGAAWSRVEYEDTFGWAATEFIGDGTDDGDGGDDGSDPGTPNQAATTTDDLNLRAGPSLDDEVLLVMPAGAEILIGAENVDGFVPTSFDGTPGWAYFEFIAVADDEDDGDDDGDDGGTPTGEERLALDDLNLRAGPSTADAVLLVIPAGGSMTLTDEGVENGFVTVVFEGTAGWVAAEFIARPDELEAAETTDETETGDDDLIDEELAGQTRVTLDDLNLREGPSTDDAVLLLIPAGETVTLTGVGFENGFITVEYGETTGWVAAEFLGE
jgi:uncharacterized protein YraI